MSHLVVSMAVKYDLESRLEAAHAAQANAERRATLAENAKVGYRQAAILALRDCARELKESRERTAAAQVLRSLARRLELEAELAAIIPGRI